MADPYIGEIILFAGNFPIRGYAFCDGQLLQIAQNTALFSLLGTIYGGDGRVTFALPDLRSRLPKHMGNGPGLPNFPIGSRGGTYQQTLTTAQLPPHSHGFNVPAFSGSGDTDEPDGAFVAGGRGDAFQSAGGESMGTGNTNNTGSGQAFNIMNPFLGIHYEIALTGVYPTRN